MQQISLSSAHPSLAILYRPQPPIRPVDDADASAFGRRLPYSGRLPRPSASIAAGEVSFLDHLRRLS